VRIAIVIGTRPEIIKLSPVIHECERQKLDYFILHTGQHYSYNLDEVFFLQLDLPKPKYNLEVGSGTHAEELGKMLVGLEEVLSYERPDVILVEGDTNTVVSASLVASRLGIKIGHVEAGLRSYDRTMPEEVNRVITDHLSDYLFAPTESARNNLLAEGLMDGKIYVVGNTIVDVVNKYIIKGRERKSYILLTLHRQENVDNKEKFASILEGVDMIADKLGKAIYYPIHPRSEKRMNQYHLNTKAITVMPVDYLSFLDMEYHAQLILTDSGGVQEEACILGVPCVTLRNNTERPETVEIGANVIAGTTPDKIFECAWNMLDKQYDWGNPFGDGKAGEKIIKIIGAING